MLMNVKLFAVARQKAGQETIRVELPNHATVRELREAIFDQHPSLAELLPHVRFAVDSNYADDSLVIPAAAEVACIPPVSGG
jgi:molybdopterin converting factor subunit 1